MDIVFGDTETTSLNPETGEIWEFAGIRVDAETGEESVMSFMIEVDLRHADPFSLKIGKFYDRYPHEVVGPHLGKNVGTQSVLSTDGHGVVPKWEAAARIERFTRGATVVFNVPTFDENRLDRLLRDQGLLPSWHYHVLDMESIIVGYAAGKGDRFPLPYSSSDLTAYLGVPEPTDAERHTALGDARWVQRQWNEVFKDA